MSVEKKEIPNFPNYYITPDGHVWSEWRKKYVAEVVMEKKYHKKPSPPLFQEIRHALFRLFGTCGALAVWR